MIVLLSLSFFLFHFLPFSLSLSFSFSLLQSHYHTQAIDQHFNRSILKIQKFLRALFGDEISIDCV
jgi:hypothetical protein